MPNWTDSELHAQYTRVLASGWDRYFTISAATHGFAPEFLLAIASRETNIQNVRGDLRNGVYHGFGIMQVDAASFPEFCKQWTPSAVSGSIDYGARVLAQKRDYLAGMHILDLKSIAASYNTGQGNVIKSYLRHRDVDATTTGGDYGRDVLNRMEVFTRLRTQPLPKAA